MYEIARHACSDQQKQNFGHHHIATTQCRPEGDGTN